MRIHTNLTYGQMLGLPKMSGAPVRFEALSEHGSRTHARSFDVRLTGTGGRNNTGSHGPGDYDGATWDEWGAFFGALFDADPEARAGGTSKRPVYANAEHYHFATGGRFKARLESVETRTPGRARTYLPADTHKRHSWKYLGTWGDHGTAGYACTHEAGCSATRPSHAATEAFRRDHKIGA